MKMLWVLQVITPYPQVPLPLPQPTAFSSPLPSPSNATPPTQSGCSLFPLLNSVLQHNISQRVRACHFHLSSSALHSVRDVNNFHVWYYSQQDSILSLMKQVAVGDSAGLSI